jgi:signal transduction histidine kinase
MTKTWWQKPVRFGLREDTPPSRAKHIRLVNVVVYVGLLLYFIYLGWFLAIGAPAAALAVNLSTIAGLLTCWWLNHSGRHRQAAAAVVVLGISSQIYWTVAFGPQASYHLPLLAMVVWAPLFVNWQDGQRAVFALAGLAALAFGFTTVTALTSTELPGKLPFADALLETNRFAAHGITLLLLLVCALYSNRNAFLAEEALAHQAEELRAAQAKMLEGEREVALGRLASGVAHELNTPLGALRSSVDTLDKLVSRGLSPIGDEPAQKTRAERRLAKLPSLVVTIHEALDRIGQAATTLEYFTAVDAAALKPIDLRDSIDATLQLTAIEAKRNDPSELPRVIAAPARVNQALLALCDFAAQRSDQPIHIATRAQGDHVIVSIADTGPPIDRADCEALFDMDFAAQEGRVGLQVVLPLARRAVEQAGGSLVIEPSEGGARSVLSLPRKDEGSRPT